MTDFAAQFAERHGLELLRAADPAGFDAAMIQTEVAGAAMPRLSDKESGPAPVFRPKPRP